ncbi:topless-related protein 1-like [Lycium barbarum]|uniref:topless-related protein 1-like n=1 Tax=Lycium barbarum TaxID=112863 RepID=UPI00293F2D8A|nr:topless-related protein 1-like [Lycium barbarum]
MSLSKDLIFLILQFCNEENLTKTAHMLEQEAGFFFDMQRFEALVLSGNWDETENYLSSFTGVSDNKYSLKKYFEIRKQKFHEAFDRQDHITALDILSKDLIVFAESNEELHREMAQLLTLDAFRKYTPHINCENPQPELEIKALFTDHKCLEPEDQSVKKRPRPSKTIPVAKPAFPQMFFNSSIVFDDMGSATTLKAVQDSGNLYGVSFTGGMNEDVSSNLSDDFPKAVERVLKVGCSPTTMDFHLIQLTFLIVGDNVGGVELWDVSSEEKLFSRMIWAGKAVSYAFLQSITEDPCISVNQILWSSDGSLFGMSSYIWIWSGTYFLNFVLCSFQIANSGIRALLLEGSVKEKRKKFFSSVLLR